ncbi:hypothetical protein MTR67_043107 [Solanum verrucosum]|uniref:Tf2-1-like SH3-like domain-containing protein n=1 Tax=Solanum verrucosum TaxID=315347 RepID=A0AAF0UP24_SOLVR|nr:hypothetical protein MTR67_043107 [Solanum verrucosum]
MTQKINIPTWKWEVINMDFIIGLPRTRRQHDSICVIVDKVTKSVRFLAVKTTNSVEDYAKLYINSIVRLHGVPLSIRGPTDGQAERTIHTLEDMLRACMIDFKGSWDDHLPLIKFAYNNSYHYSIQMAPYEALYGHRCRSTVGWFEVGEVALIGPASIHDTMEKVSPMKEVMRFGKKGKLSPRYVGPYKILKLVGNVAYELEFSAELAAVHPVFHISLLKKCVGDPASIVQLESVAVKDSLTYEDVPVDILDRQVRWLRNKEVASVKVLWRSQSVNGANCEAEAAMKAKYPHLFPFDSTPA